MAREIQRFVQNSVQERGVQRIVDFEVKLVGEYFKTLEQYPNPRAVDLARLGK